MKTFILLVSIIIATINLANGQIIDSLAIRDTIVAQYKECLKSYQDSNVEKYVRYIHPNFRENINPNTVLNMDELDIKVISRSAQSPRKIIVNDSIIQSSMIELLRVIDKDSTISLMRYSVVAISYNNGKSWYFFNAFDPIDEIKEMIPEISYELDLIEFPKKEEFKF